LHKQHTTAMTIQNAAPPQTAMNASGVVVVVVPVVVASSVAVQKTENVESLYDCRKIALDALTRALQLLALIGQKPAWLSVQEEQVSDETSPTQRVTAPNAPPLTSPSDAHRLSEYSRLRKRPAHQ